MPRRLPWPRRSLRLRRLMGDGGMIELRRVVVRGRVRIELCAAGTGIDPRALTRLEDASVDAVSIRDMPSVALTGRRSSGLREAVRVLKPGGRLSIRTDAGTAPHLISGELRRLGCVGVVVRELKSGDLAVEARRGRRPIGPELHRACGPPRVLAPVLERSHTAAVVS